MLMRSDGSQAKKLKDEKVLVMIRIEKNGIPVYFVVSPVEMEQYEGTDANSIKQAIDNVFFKKFGITEEQYLYSMVSGNCR